MMGTGFAEAIAMKDLRNLLIFVVAGCSVGFLLGRYLWPDVPEQYEIAPTSCSVPACPDASKCELTLLRCDVAYVTWKERAEKCQSLLADVWVEVPNYEEYDKLKESDAPAGEGAQEQGRGGGRCRCKRPRRPAFLLLPGRDRLRRRPFLSLSTPSIMLVP